MAKANRIARRHVKLTDHHSRSTTLLSIAQALPSMPAAIPVPLSTPAKEAPELT